MIEALRSLRLEIDSVTASLRAASGVIISDQRLLERAEQLFLAWSTSLRPRLAASGVPEEVLVRADKAFGKLARLTARRSKRRNFLLRLSAIRRVLTEQVLLEVAKVSATPQIATGAAVEERLIPEIADLRNELIPNAIYGWTPYLRAFLKQYTFDHNVFLMFAYRRRLSRLVHAVRNALRGLELNAIIAREHNLTDDLYNPIACLLCCNYGIAIFDQPETRQIHNPNIIYELSIMHILKRPCVILKHDSVRVMPSDFLHKLYESYSSEAEAIKRIHEWWARITSR